MKWPTKDKISAFVSKALIVSFWALSITEISKLLSYRLSSYDFWWHLSAGRTMIQTQSILRTDIFSHTLFGHEWINFEWLAQVLMTLAYDWVGPQGMVLIKVQLVWFSILLIVYCLYRQGVRGPSLLLVLWLSYYLIRPRSMVRPELATLLFLPLFVILILVARDAVQRRRNHILGVMMGVMVVWSNLHGGFLYGIALTGLLWVGSIWAKEDVAYQRFLFRCAFLLPLVALINPYGYKIYEVAFIHMSHFKAGPILISEWRSPGLKAVPVFWTLFFVVGAVLVAGLLQRDTKTKFWTPAVLIFLLWGTSHYRNTALFPFIALPFLGEAFPSAIRPHMNARWIRIATVAAWVLCFIPVQGKAKDILRPWPKHVIRWHNFPHRACKVVRTLNIRGKMFNNYEYGGYIQYALGPDRKVFIDGRYLFYPLLAQYAPFHTTGSVEKSQALWARFFTTHQVDYAIVSNKTLSFPMEKIDSHQFRHGLAMFPKQTWALIHWDDEAHLYVKRVEKFATIIDEHEFKVLRPFNIERMGYELKKGLIQIDQIKAEVERHKSQVKKSYLRNFIDRWIKKKEKTESLFGTRPTHPPREDGGSLG